MALARIGLGANLGDAPATIRAAFAALAALGTVTRTSALYLAKPWGVVDQPEFVNAAALLETRLEPHALLAGLQRIETALGRTETYRWGPRAIDLDILAYDERAINEPDLTIPHPRLRERAFALVPLAEIDPAFEAALAALPQRLRDEVRLLES